MEAPVDNKSRKLIRILAILILVQLLVFTAFFIYSYKSGKTNYVADNLIYRVSRQHLPFKKEYSASINDGKITIDPRLEWINSSFEIERKSGFVASVRSVDQEIELEIQSIERIYNQTIPKDRYGGLCRIEITESETLSKCDSEKIPEVAELVYLYEFSDTRDQTKLFYILVY